MSTTIIGGTIVTPAFLIDSIQEQRAAKADGAFQELYLDGLTDGAFGDRPQRNEEPYVLGYAEGLRRTRDKGEGEIRRSKPTDHFAFGYVDSPDPVPEPF